MRGGEAKGLALGWSLKKEVASMREAVAIWVSRGRVWGNLKARVREEEEEEKVFFFLKGVD